MISLLALIIVLCIFEGGSLLCKASSIANSQLRRRSFDSKTIKDDVMQPEVNQIQEEQESFIKSQSTPQQTPQSTGFFDLSVKGIFNSCLNGLKRKTKEPAEYYDPVKLATRTISGREADLLAPELFKNLEMTELRRKRIQINEIIIAALKIRSLMPNMPVKDPQNSGKFSIDESSNMALSATTFHIFNSIDLLIKTLPEDHQHQFDVSKQVFGFDFEGSKTLDEFINEKESEIAKHLRKGSAEVSRLKKLLYCTSSTSSIKLNSVSIKLIVEQLDKLKQAYEDSKVAQFMYFRNRLIRIHNILYYHGKISKIMEKLGEILEKL